MHKLLRKWTCQVLHRNPAVVAIAARQRAKFEGWLKYELAVFAQSQGAQTVEVEARLPGGSSNRARADVAMRFRGVRYHVELKTPNTSWKVPGIRSATRPITNNVRGVIRDAKKLRKTSARGLVLFVMFPIPPGDDRWAKYIDRISTVLKTRITADSHCRRVSVAVAKEKNAQLVVGCFVACGGHGHRRRWMRTGNGRQAAPGSGR